MSVLVRVTTVVVLAGLCLLVLWVLSVRSRQPIKDKLAVLLQLVTAYTLMLGLFSSSGVFEAYEELQRDLTSTNPLVFLAANFQAFAIIFSAMAVALDPNTTSSTPRFLLGLPVLLSEMLLAFVYAIVHFLAIVPIAYFGYLVTSVPIDAILNSAADVEVTYGEQVMRIKQLVSEDETAMRNFAVALPAFATSLVIKVGPLVRGRRHAPGIPGER